MWVAVLAGRVQFLRRRACASFAPVGVHTIINWESHRGLLLYPEFPASTFWSYRHIMPMVGAPAAFPPLGLLMFAIGSILCTHCIAGVGSTSSETIGSTVFSGGYFVKTVKSRYQRPAPRDRHTQDRARRRDGARQARDDAQRSSR